jgi:cytoskeletal protein RodZ
MDTSPPWSRTGSPSVTLPPPAGGPPPPPLPTSPRGGETFPTSFPQPPGPRNRNWLWATLGLLLVIVVSAAIGSLVTFAAAHTNAMRPEAQPSTAAPASMPAAPQFSVADAATAKQNLCHVFDVSVGQKGQGGYRVEGNLNMPVTLQAVTSALAVENALVPAVPADVASAARRYITTTLDVATAAMGNTSINEINRLTTVSNGAIDALFDACGLTR